MPGRPWYIGANMNIIHWDNSAENREAIHRILTRSERNIDDLRDQVGSIIREVQERGDAALRDFAKKFDGVDFGTKPLRVSEVRIENSEEELDPALAAALRYAIRNVEIWHKKQVHKKPLRVKMAPGLEATEKVTPINSVALYVPRGRGSFPSMLYMLAVPARLAGVPNISILTPPGPDGEPDAACLYAAKLAGVTNIYLVGGAQAVAAAAFGTESIPRAQKIVGPGSAWVSAAKRLLADRIDAGLPAGPSESIVWSDGSGSPWNTALDLLTEAEHGADSSAVLVTENEAFGHEVARIAEGMIAGTPEPRKSFLEKLFGPGGYGGVLVTESPDESADFINEYAPEHLSIQTRNPARDAELIYNASEILLGPDLPFSAANYLCGPNAILPTGGYAKLWSSVGVRDFQKCAAVISANGRAYKQFRDHVIVLAEYEGFPRHAAALKDRRPNRRAK